MSQLSAQSIKGLCEPRGLRKPMISPFVPTKQVLNGKSYGLSAASYDLRIAHDLVLGPHPGHILVDMLATNKGFYASETLREFHMYAEKGMPPCFALAHTVEDFAMPDDVSGQICDKSTYARLGLSCFNTFFDPGFHGNGTLELVNLSPQMIVIRAGDPICQIVFNWLDKPTDIPYVGKYQGQHGGPVAAILEEALQETGT